MKKEKVVVELEKRLNTKQKREVNEIWKDGYTWLLKCPHGIMSFKRKRDAVAVANTFGIMEKE